MTPYKHKIQYYETDKMGITHHSNYIRIMEEARVDYLNKIGYSFNQMEKDGLISPTVTVSGNFKKPTTFDDEIEIVTKITEVTPARSFWKYTMTLNGEIVFEGTSSHCFVDANGRPISLKKISPKLYDMLVSLVEKE